jgi:hypothetical protein
VDDLSGTEIAHARSWNSANPMVFLDIYDDGKIYWVAREYYWDSAAQMRQKTDAEYADDLAAFIGADRNAIVIIDPSAASFKAEMSKRRIWHVDADNDVNEGIRIVSMLLNQRKAKFCRQTAQKRASNCFWYARIASPNNWIEGKQCIFVFWF